MSLHVTLQVHGGNLLPSFLPSSTGWQIGTMQGLDPPTALTWLSEGYQEVPTGLTSSTSPRSRREGCVPQMPTSYPASS